MAFTPYTWTICRIINILQAYQICFMTMIISNICSCWIVHSYLFRVLSFITEGAGGLIQSLFSSCTIKICLWYLSTTGLTVVQWDGLFKYEIIPIFNEIDGSFALSPVVCCIMFLMWLTRNTPEKRSSSYFIHTKCAVFWAESSVETRLVHVRVSVHLAVENSVYD